MLLRIIDSSALFSYGKGKITFSTENISGMSPAGARGSTREGRTPPAPRGPQEFPGGYTGGHFCSKGSKPAHIPVRRTCICPSILGS